ncbi:predicted protein, partial [Nematostella vectensis]
MEISFKGKRALVTGAGKGIGRGVAKALVRCGAEVVAISRTKADLDSLRDEVPSIQAVCDDVADIEKMQKLIESQETFDLLVNNAGFAIFESFLEIKPESFDRMHETNVRAPLFIAQAVAKKMVAKGEGGAIVNVSSVFTELHLPNSISLVSNKAAMDRMTKGMAMELGHYKIRVNTVNPTVVWTDAAKKAFGTREGCKMFEEKCPLGRIA